MVSDIDFHDLKYFEVGFFSIFLEFVIDLRASLHKLVEKHQSCNFMKF